MGERATERRRAREHALRFLFGLDFTEYDWDEALLDFWEVIPEDEADTVPVNAKVKRYAETLIRGVCGDRESLDARIGEALENWTPDRIGHIERAVLRVAAYEMFYVDDVPAAVAINEAIEVARRYGGDDAPRFINGVLDRLRVRESSAR